MVLLPTLQPANNPVQIRYRENFKVGSRTMKLSVSFSGGSTSGYMAYLLKRDWEAGELTEYDSIEFVFANTGAEHPKTYEFVERCNQEWGLDLVYLEAVIDPRPRKGTTYKVVTHDTLCRDGRLFYEMAAKYGVPNNTFGPCTRELKTVPMDKYRGKDAMTAIGIRCDELDRISSRYRENNWTYPLIFKYGVRKVDVYAWWDKQPFNLGINQLLGNCTFCFHKSFHKLGDVYKENPANFDIALNLDKHYSLAGARKLGQENTPRQMYRGYRTTQDVIDMVTGDSELSKRDGNCSGSCEPHGEQMELSYD